MQGWQTTDPGMRGLPRDITGFELLAFFTFRPAERTLIDARCGDAHRLGLAVHIGFLRMSGQIFDTFRIVPPALWCQLGIDAPEPTSPRALCGRSRTLFDHQQVACEAFGFRWMSEAGSRLAVRRPASRTGRLGPRLDLWSRRAGPS